MTQHDQGPEEHRVYIAVEETMTDVRERLARLPYKHVILVVPSQTQLRHAIAWKVLARWALEQGKQMAVASSDKQIRALARSVQFMVIPAELSSEQHPRTLQQKEGQGKKRGKAS